MTIELQKYLRSIRDAVEHVAQETKEQDVNFVMDEVEVEIKFVSQSNGEIRFPTTDDNSEALSRIRLSMTPRTRL